MNEWFVTYLHKTVAELTPAEAALTVIIGLLSLLLVCWIFLKALSDGPPTVIRLPQGSPGQKNPFLERLQIQDEDEDEHNVDDSHK